MLLFDSVVHVAAHTLTAFQKLSRAESSFDSKSLVKFDKRLYPRVDKEVVADSYLAGCGEMVFVKQQVEDSTIKDDVAMVADEGITFWSG